MWSNELNEVILVILMVQVALGYGEQLRSQIAFGVFVTEFQRECNPASSTFGRAPCSISDPNIQTDFHLLLPFFQISGRLVRLTSLDYFAAVAITRRRDLSIDMQLFKAF